MKRQSSTQLETREAGRLEKRRKGERAEREVLRPFFSFRGACGRYELTEGERLAAHSLLSRYRATQWQRKKARVEEDKTELILAFVVNRSDSTYISVLVLDQIQAQS
jgi:hypothetical protein